MRGDKPLFSPAEYAKPTCGACGGSGIITVHVPINGKVIPKVRNLSHTTCGCASKRYIKAIS